MSGLVSDPVMVSKLHNGNYDPKGQDNQIDTIAKGKESFYHSNTIPTPAVVPVLVSDPVMVLKFHNGNYDPKGQDN